MAAAPALVIFLCWQAYEKIVAAPAAAQANVVLQWAIILMIFVPVCGGLFLFGRYAWAGEYDHLPESSSEITDYNSSPID